MSQNQHLTHAMLRKSATTTPKQSTLQGPLAKMGMEAGLETWISNGVPRDPAILLDLVNFVVVFKHCVHAFSTTTPTETSFCRAAFYFWKLWNWFEMILDVFGIVNKMRMDKRLFLECDGEFKHIEFTQHDGEKFEKNVCFLCMPPLPLQQHGRAETGEDQTMHVARARQLSWTDSLFPLCFLWWKRNRGYCSEAVVSLGCFLFIRSTRS